MTIGEQGRREPTARWHKVLGGGASLVLLVLILVEVVPKFASYSRAWAAMTHLSAWWWVAIAGVAFVNQISGVWPYQAALPGLGFWDGFLEVETTGAIANTVPAGGAVAIGMTYKMFSSFGFSAVDISTAIVATGIWNFAAKLGLPVAAHRATGDNGAPDGTGPRRRCCRPRRHGRRRGSAVVALPVHRRGPLARATGRPRGQLGTALLWKTGDGSDRALPFRVQESDRPHRSPSRVAAHGDDAGQSARGIRAGPHHRARRGYPGGTGLACRRVHLVHDRAAGGGDSDHARRSRDARCCLHQPDDRVRRQFLSRLGGRSHLAIDGLRPPDHPGHR